MRSIVLVASSIFVVSFLSACSDEDADTSSTSNGGGSGGSAAVAGASGASGQGSSGAGASGGSAAGTGGAGAGAGGSGNGAGASGASAGAAGEGQGGSSQAGTAGASGASGAGASGAGGSSAGSAGQGGAGASGGAGAGGSGGAGGGSACLPDDVLAVLNEHLMQLDATAALTNTHPGPKEAVGFLQVPGYAKGVTAVFAGPLIEVCSKASKFDPYCEEGHCSQIECTGKGAGWIMHHSIDPVPVSQGDWTFTKGAVDTEWTDGEVGMRFVIRVAAKGPSDRDWSMDGDGIMNQPTPGLWGTETFPALFAAGAAKLTFVSAPSGHSGELMVAGIKVAEVNADGVLVATGACP